MKTLKIFITTFVGLGLVLCCYFCIESILSKDFVYSTFFGVIFVFFVGLIYEIWSESTDKKKQKLLFEKKYTTLIYVVNHKKGSKKLFCKLNGEDMYNYCLEKGLIHEPLSCDPDNISWEATRFAFIKYNELNH